MRVGRGGVDSAALVEEALGAEVVKVGEDLRVVVHTPHVRDDRRALRDEVALVPVVLDNVRTWLLCKRANIPQLRGGERLERAGVSTLKPLNGKKTYPAGQQGASAGPP